MNVSAPTVSQRAAVAALGAEAKLELEGHVRKYEANKEVVVAGLTRMGVRPSEYAPPQGAFYMCRRRGSNPGPSAAPWRSV